MGLDKDDTIVKRRIAQKMQFLAEDVAAAREPAAAQLRDWYQQHSDQFAMAARSVFATFTSRPIIAGRTPARTRPAP